MKRIRFTEEQIIAVLREREAGAKTADFRGSTAFRKPRCTTGRPNTADGDVGRQASAIDQPFRAMFRHSAFNALSNNVIDGRWRNRRMRSGRRQSYLLRCSHRVRSGSTLCFIREIKKRRGGSHAAI